MARTKGHRRRRTISTWRGCHSRDDHVKRDLKDTTDERRRCQDRRIDELARSGADFENIVVKSDNELATLWMFE